MLPLALVTDVDHLGMDTVIVWHDGDRAIAYGYRGGTTMRTAPLADAPLDQMIDEAREAFGFEGGRAASVSPGLVRWK